MILYKMVKNVLHLKRLHQELYFTGANTFNTLSAYSWLLA